MFSKEGRKLWRAILFSRVGNKQETGYVELMRHTGNTGKESVQQITIDTIETRRRIMGRNNNFNLFPPKIYREYASFAVGKNSQNFYQSPLNLGEGLIRQNPIRCYSDKAASKKNKHGKKKGKNKTKGGGEGKSKFAVADIKDRERVNDNNDEVVVSGSTGGTSSKANFSTAKRIRMETGLSPKALRRPLPGNIDRLAQTPEFIEESNALLADVRNRKLEFEARMRGLKRKPRKSRFYHEDEVDVESLAVGFNADMKSDNNSENNNEHQGNKESDTKFKAETKAKLRMENEVDLTTADLTPEELQQIKEYFGDEEFDIMPEDEYYKKKKSQSQSHSQVQSLRNNKQPKSVLKHGQDPHEQSNEKEEKDEEQKQEEGRDYLDAPDLSPEEVKEVQQFFGAEKVNILGVEAPPEKPRRRGRNRVRPTREAMFGSNQSNKGNTGSQIEVKEEDTKTAVDEEKEEEKKEKENESVFHGSHDQQHRSLSWTSTIKDSNSNSNFGFASSKSNISLGLRELQAVSRVKMTNEKIGNRRIGKDENYIDLLHQRRLGKGLLKPEEAEQDREENDKGDNDYNGVVESLSFNQEKYIHNMNMKDSIHENISLNENKDDSGVSVKQLRLSKKIVDTVYHCFTTYNLCPAYTSTGEPIVRITDCFLSKDLRHAIIYWTPEVLNNPAIHTIGGSDLTYDRIKQLRNLLREGISKELEKKTKEIRFVCAATLNTKRIPAFEFRIDEAIEMEHEVAPYLIAAKRERSRKAREAKPQAEAQFQLRSRETK